MRPEGPAEPVRSLDLGAPISYEVLERGAPIYARDGDVGRVEHVLADEDADIFDGLVIEAGAGEWRFADAGLVDAIHERGVVLALDAAGAQRLPEPSDNPAALRADPAATDESLGRDLERKLKRAWDLISGNY